MDERGTDSSNERAPLARRAPAARTEPIETEAPEVVDRVASLLGKWAEEDDER